MDNPLLVTGPVPAFDRIEVAHFLPAADSVIADIQQQLADMKSDKSAPTFTNTAVPLSHLFAPLEYIVILAEIYAMNVGTPEISEMQEALSIKFAAIAKTVFQDADLGARFRAVYDVRASLDAAGDDYALLAHLHQSFEASGALLDAEGQKQIREIDDRLISLSQKFRDNLMEAPQHAAVLITDPAELAGLTADDISTLASNARENGHKEGWLFIPERLLVDELLERAESRVFREKIFKALEGLCKAGPYDNGKILTEILAERESYAHLLGYDHYGDFARSRFMKKDLGDVHRLLADITAQALPKFEADMRGLEAFSAENGGPEKLEPWDVPYWIMRQRDHLFQFDANKFSEHLELENVMKGMFNEASHLFGISFAETGKYSKVHDDIRVYEVTDTRTGDLVGLLHVDMFARKGKYGGAWMMQMQVQDEGHVNIVNLNMNIAKPSAGNSATFSLSQYITLYHEMGHSLQGLLGTNVAYPSLMGTAGPSDFVEFHSMVNERRATLPENLKAHALHVTTGQPPSDEIIAALTRSKEHFATLDTLKIVQNSLRDIGFHTIAAADYKGDIALEKAVALDSPYIAHVRPYSLTRFSHPFDSPHSGYATGYVNYLIAEIYAADGFTPFADKPYDAAWAQRLDALYRRGSGGDILGLYKDYRGADATPAAMLQQMGIEAGIAPRNGRQAKPKL